MWSTSSFNTVPMVALSFQSVSVHRAHQMLGWYQQPNCSTTPHFGMGSRVVVHTINTLPYWSGHSLRKWETCIYAFLCLRGLKPTVPIAQDSREPRLPVYWPNFQEGTFPNPPPPSFESWITSQSRFTESKIHSITYRQTWRQEFWLYIGPY